LGDYIFTIDLGQGRTIPVVLLGEITGRQPEEKVEIYADQKLRIFGFLLPLDDFSLVTKPASINEQDKDQLRAYAQYIIGVRVVVLNPS